MIMELPEKIDAPEAINIEECASVTLDQQPEPEQPEQENRKDEAITRDQLMATVKAIAETDGADISTDDVARIKQQFYTLHNEAIRKSKAEFVEAGNAPEAFTPAEDPMEVEFKACLSRIREKKAEYRARVEAEQLKNFELKRNIIAELEKMAADTDTVNLHYQRVKDLQNEFKSIGDVPATEATHLWKAYQDAVEHFYDQWKVNKELRDYDFKKNLSEKQLLIDEAVALAGEEDVITAFRRLQDLHAKWRDVGPVAKELREEIWTRFKDASAEVSKRYQAHFEARKAVERQNEDAKKAIIESIEALDFSAPRTFAQWDAMTRTIIDAQTQWKTIGFASRKTNNALFTRFRQLCDEFFAKKAEFFQKMKNDLAENLAKKTALAEKAEALAESTDWKKTTEQIAALQKEWRTIGAVTRKHSDAVWQRFIKACDTFFDRKKKATSGVRKAELANLEAKREIIEKLNALNSTDDTTPRDEAVALIHQLRTNWQGIGHVPFKEKDKLQETYRELVGALFEKFDVKEHRARLESFEAGLEAAGSDPQKLSRERDRLLRTYEQRRQELNTYENNLGFLTSTSKNGNSLIHDMERKMQRLREDIEQIQRKIAIVDSKSK